MKKLHWFAAALVCVLVAGTTPAAVWVGDLVYCDDNENGIYEPAGGDFPLNDVTVNMVCVDTLDNITCADYTTVTGGPLHPSAGNFINNWANNCNTVTAWDATDASTFDGRYLFNIFNDCVDPLINQVGLNPTQNPIRCTITVDESTLPVDCDGIVTPRTLSFPLDGNNDGDRCDAGVDGPFPEDEALSYEGGACDPNPGDGVFYPVFNFFAENCLSYNDFGYAFDNNVQENPTRTLGYWKNHPDATKMFLPFADPFCGEQIDEHCDAYAFLSLGGGGLNNFKRQAMAALFNCAAWGCSDDVADLIQAGSDACAANDPSFDYGNAGEVLDIFNNSGDDLPLGFDGGRAKPKYCKNGNKNVKDRMDRDGTTTDTMDTGTSDSTDTRDLGLN